MTLSSEPDAFLGRNGPSPSGPEPVPAPLTPARHRALYRRWRAQTFAEIVGQEAVVETLRNSVRLGRVGHAYLFSGPRGTGKTSMARILAKAVNCDSLIDGEPCDRCPACVAIREGTAFDVIEIDAASNRGIDQVRALRDLTRLAPSDLRRRVFIVDEAHQITRDGWPALLKTLEEPSGGVLFIFASTNPADIPPTILSRVQRFSFRPLTASQIAGKLQRILAAEGRQAEPEAVALIAGLASGGMRDAESMLEQLLSASGGTLTVDEVQGQLGMAPASLVEAFLEALLAGEALAGVRVLDRVEEEGRDLRLFTEQAVERLRRAMVARMTGETAGDRLAAMASLPEIAAAARSLAGLDPQRALVGGQRFQLELILLSGARESRPQSRPQDPEVPMRVPRVAVAAPSGPARQRAAGVPRQASAAAPGAAGGGETAPGASASSEVLARLVRGWPEVVAHVSRNPAVRPLVAACRPVRVDGDVVVLGFPEDKQFLREKAEQRLPALEEGIAAVLGGGYRVRCVAANVEALGAPAEAVIGRENLEQARRVFGDDLVDVPEVE
jgi:DNA polymerase-3 subunit gamma/tau